MVETKLENEEVFKHFNEMRRDQCQIADIKDLLTEDKKEKIFAIKRFNGKGIVLHPLGVLDSMRIANEFKDEIRKYQDKAIKVKKILLKKKEDWTEEEKNLIVSEMNTTTMDYEIALITATIKEPKMSREQTRDFLNSLSEDEFSEFIMISSKFFNVSTEEFEKIKNL